MEAEWLVLNNALIQLETALCQAVATAWMARVENRHIVLLRHLVNSGKQRGKVLFGINVFFPDHIASGESEGTHCGFGYHEREDCMKWLKYMTDHFGKDIKIILHGVSMGSATVCMMTGRNDLPENVKFTVADCGFTTAKDLFKFKMDGLGIPDMGLLKGVNLANRINHGFDFRDIAPVESVKNAKVPMLFVHGKEDNLVPSYMAKELFDNCSAPYRDILIVEGADHAQAHVDGKQEYEDKIDAFIEKFVK